MSKRSLGGFGLGAFGMLLLLAVAFFFYSVEALGQNNELQVRCVFHQLICAEDIVTEGLASHY